LTGSRYLSRLRHLLGLPVAEMRSNLPGYGMRQNLRTSGKSPLHSTIDIMPFEWRNLQFGLQDNRISDDIFLSVKKGFFFFGILEAFHDEKDESKRHNPQTKDSPKII
jgi:hypothetical protein